MSLASVNSMRALAFLTWLLRQYLCIFPRLLSLLPPSVCFLIVFEFVWELFILPHRFLDIFALLPLYWNASLLSLEKVILKYQSAFLGLSFLQGVISWYSTKQIPEETKVCFSEIQGCELAMCPPHASKISNATIS